MNESKRKLLYYVPMKRLLRNIINERDFMFEDSYSIPELREVRKMIDEYLNIIQKRYGK